MTKLNEKSVELIKQIYQPDLKPSQILELADQTKVKQIREAFTDFQCGYCARGFINQFLTKGEFDYWSGSESTWDKRKEILKLKTVSEHFFDHIYADQRLIALKKYGKPFNELLPSEFEDVINIALRIQSWNDKGLTFKQIAEKLEEIGL